MDLKPSEPLITATSSVKNDLQVFDDYMTKAREAKDRLDELVDVN